MVYSLILASKKRFLLNRVRKEPVKTRWSSQSWAGAFLLTREPASSQRGSLST